MILNKEGGLKTDDLNSVQTGMMTGNRIPGLLELRIKDVDFQVELHYDISGQRMLSQIWKGGECRLPISTGFFLKWRMPSIVVHSICWICANLFCMRIISL